MPCPHNEITIVQRSQRQSAVAAAAYQSGEKLFCEYDQEVKHYPEKRGIVHNEILLPENAPPEYADRNTLWNAAEAVEKQWNSQLARRWVLTIPREIPPDQYAVLVREFCEQQFVSKGMIVDFAIHDPHPPGHNPHAHVLLTMRAMDEHGKWLPKSRKVYDFDENGERIKLPSGRWKSHKEDTVDWNDQKYCEIWRHEWEVIQNRYLEANDRPERVDLRSYARQGLDIIPTVHEGAAVRQMEKRGIQTNIGNLNREIRAANRLMKSIRQLIQNLKGWITELGEKRKELLAQKAAEEATLLPNLWVDHKIALTFGNAVEQHRHGVGRAVFYIPLLIGAELTLCLPQDHAVQPSELCPHAALRKRGIANTEAVGIKKPLNGVFKHQSGFRCEAFKLAAVQNIQKFFFCVPVGPSVLRRGSDRRTDFHMTLINLSFFFLTWRQFLRFWERGFCSS